MKRIYLVLIFVFVLIFLIFLFKPKNIRGSLPEPTLKVEERIKKERENAIINAVKKVQDAVVSITCIKTKYVREFSPFFEDPFFKEFFGELFPPRYYTQKIVSQGSGFIISKEGYIFTNEHVIREADTIKITLPDGRIFDAKLIGKDYSFDIALLKIEGKDLPCVTLGNSDSLLRGEWVIALGNPFGYLWEDAQPTITVGVVSALHRNFKGSEEREYKNLIQTDAAINPGNSGGPLCDAGGRVIGMNTFIITKSGGFEGVGFAIPVNLLKKVLPHLIKYGEIKRGEIGIEVDNITDEIKKKYNLKEKEGVVVIYIDEKSPFHGILKEGDVIKKINGYIVKNLRDYEIKTYDLLEGEKIEILYKRNGIEKLVERFLKGKEEFLDLGIKVADINDYYIKKYDLKVKKGALIIKVKSGSFAENMGLEEGDIIVNLNGNKIEGKEDFERNIRKIKNYIEMVIVRGRSQFILEYRIR